LNSFTFPLSPLSFFFFPQTIVRVDAESDFIVYPFWNFLIVLLFSFRPFIFVFLQRLSSGWMQNQTRLLILPVDFLELFSPHFFPFPPCFFPFPLCFFPVFKDYHQGGCRIRLYCWFCLQISLNFLPLNLFPFPLIFFHFQRLSSGWMQDPTFLFTLSQISWNCFTFPLSPPLFFCKRLSDAESASDSLLLKVSCLLETFKETINRKVSCLLFTFLFIVFLNFLEFFFPQFWFFSPFIFLFSTDYRQGG